MGPCVVAAQSWLTCDSNCVDVIMDRSDSGLYLTKVLATANGSVSHYDMDSVLAWRVSTSDQSPIDSLLIAPVSLPFCTKQSNIWAEASHWSQGFYSEIWKQFLHFASSVPVHVSAGCRPTYFGCEGAAVWGWGHCFRCMWSQQGRNIMKGFQLIPCSSWTNE